MTPREITTWREQLAAARQANGDTTPVAAVAGCCDDVLDAAFDPGYGGAEGPDVLIWTEDFVYFPVTYDGAKSLGSAPRNPRPEPQHHVGGE